MSMIEACTTTKPPSRSSRSGSFLGCFGFSGKKMQLPDEVKSGSRRRGISKWKFSFKKSAVKTVPVDHTTTVSVKCKPFLPSETHAPAMADKAWEIQVVEDDATLTKKPVIMDDSRCLVEDAAEGTITVVDTKKHSSRRRKSTDSDKSQNRSSGSRRKETKTAAASTTDVAAALNRPSSMGKKSLTTSHPVVSTPLKPPTHSAPLLPSKIKIPPSTPPVGGKADDGTLYESTSSASGVDSLIGMSVILVTLIIMMLWGKLCAILCACSWFFVAPRLATAVEHSGIPTTGKRLPESHNNVDLESAEYKKKVVLEGLLQRNHRNVVGRL